MTKSRVLILHSHKDKGYQARLQQITNNPSLDGISFQHCCVIDHDRGSNRIARLDRLPDMHMDPTERRERMDDLLAEIVKEEVGPLMDKHIAALDPEVVIVHSGTVFSAVPGACITMIMKLMDKYPGLPFALERKEDWLVERVPKVRNLIGMEHKVAINQNRWVENNFIDDDEVEKIIKGVFG